jgi:indole-3-glycerol phosphate synthase
MPSLETLFYYTVLAVCTVPTLVLLAFLLVAVVTAIASPSVVGAIVTDLRAIRERDPAAEGWIACVCYPGWWALNIHRLAAHPLYKLGLRTPARLFNFLARFMSGCDIHPGAVFGRGVFIDHAHGVVIGETAVIGSNVTMLHQVTLGGTGKQGGKRHPTIEEGVLLGVGAKVLGNIVIGKNSKIGAGSVVVHTVPPNSTVVGIPGRVVASGGQRIPSQQLDQTSLPDPLIERIRQHVHDEVKRMEDKMRKDKDKFKSDATGTVASTDVLAEICDHKRDEIDALQTVRPLHVLRSMTTRRCDLRNFSRALRAPGISLIAEIKKASPSGGLLRADFNPASIAETYAQNGASALSVLTNEKYFQGSLEYVAQARAAANLPILRKEFIVDEYQIIEAERYGADAILLIAACLDEIRLRDFRETAEGEGLDALVEVHDEAELEMAIKSGASIIGINNRNLKTLETNIETTFTLLGKLSKRQREELILVSESGIKTHDDIIRLKDFGVNAVLIGETFMRAPDIGAKVREVMGFNPALDYSI